MIRHWSQDRSRAFSIAPVWFLTGPSSSSVLIDSEIKTYQLRLVFLLAAKTSGGLITVVQVEPGKVGELIIAKFMVMMMEI